MLRLFGALVIFSLALSTARADDAAVILDKAITALGGEEKLSKVNAMTWKTKGKIIFNDNENEFDGQTTIRGVEHFRSEFEGEFNGNPVKGVTVLSGDKGWRHIGDNVMTLKDDALANEKRTVYLQAVPVLLVPLKGKGFKVEQAGEETVSGKPAIVLKATGPDGKSFTLSFDKESGLPVKQVATVAGFGGEDFTQETTFGEYKSFDGIKKATKIESKRDGQRFLELHLKEFKALDNVDEATFAEPK